MGAIGTIGFAIAWWRTRRKLNRLESTLPDPGRLDERLGSLESTTDFISARIADLADTQALLVRQLGVPLDRTALPQPGRDEAGEPRTPRTPH